MKGAALIVNARSRTGEKAFEKAAKLLSSLGVEVGASYALHDPARLPETVREAVGEGHDPIILGVPPIGGGSDEMARYRAIMRSAIRIAARGPPTFASFTVAA